MQEKIKQPYIAPVLDYIEVKMEEGISAGSGENGANSGGGCGGPGCDGPGCHVVC